MRQRSYKRAVAVTWGPSSTVQPASTNEIPDVPSIGNLDDDGPRITFELERTNRGEPDRGKVQIYNLTRKTGDSIRNDFEAVINGRKEIFRANKGPPRSPNKVIAQQLRTFNESHRIEVSAGYQRVPELVFRGEYVDVSSRKRVGPTDFVTEILLGDSFTSLRDGFLDQPLGIGTTIPQLIQEFASATGLKTSEDARARIAAVAPQSTITLFQNGAAGAIPAIDQMNDIADLLGLSWFVRNGELYFLPNGGVISDFAIQLTEGVDLLDFNTQRGYRDIRARALMNARIEPGRGMLLRDNGGKLLGNGQGYVVRSAKYMGDTHGQQFYVDFEATEALEPIPGVAQSISQAVGLVG